MNKTDKEIKNLIQTLNKGATVQFYRDEFRLQIARGATLTDLAKNFYKQKKENEHV